MLTIDRTPMMVKFEKETGGSATYSDYNDWLQMEVENKTQAYINWLEKIAKSTELKECPSCGAEVIPNPYCHDLEQKIELLEMELAEAKHKGEPCEYCRNANRHPLHLGVLWIEVRGDELEVEYEDSYLTHQNKIDINYCPKCDRDLEED